MATLREVKKRIRTVKSTSEFSIIVLALTLLLTSSGDCFDGNRKGFVLGGGLGFAPSSSWSGEILNITSGQVIDTNENGAGLGLNFMIGHAWDEKNMIVFEVNGAGWNSDLLVGKPSIAQGIIGTVWYHYFRAPGRSIFTAAGLVFYRFAMLKSSTLSQNFGNGIMLGGGYEFARHWQIGGYLGLGNSSESYGFWHYSHLNVLVNGVLF